MKYSSRSHEAGKRPSAEAIITRATLAAAGAAIVCTAVVALGVYFVLPGHGYPLATLAGGALYGVIELASLGAFWLAVHRFEKYQAPVLIGTYIGKIVMLVAGLLAIGRFVEVRIAGLSVAGSIIIGLIALAVVVMRSPGPDFDEPM